MRNFHYCKPVCYSINVQCISASIGLCVGQCCFMDINASCIIHESLQHSDSLMFIQVVVITSLTRLILLGNPREHKCTSTIIDILISLIAKRISF